MQSYSDPFNRDKLTERKSFLSAKRQTEKSPLRKQVCLERLKLRQADFEGSGVATGKKD